MEVTMHKGNFRPLTILSDRLLFARFFLCGKICERTGGSSSYYRYGYCHISRCGRRGSVNCFDGCLGGRFGFGFSFGLGCFYDYCSTENRCSANVGIVPHFRAFG